MFFLIFPPVITLDQYELSIKVELVFKNRESQKIF